MRTLLVIALLAAGCGGWTTADTAAQLAVTASLAVDYQQTTKALDGKDSIETNPIMGPNGDRVPPAIYFPACAFAAAGAAAALPRPWRGFLQGTIFAVQVNTITGNWVRFGRVW